LTTKSDIFFKVTKFPICLSFEFREIHTNMWGLTGVVANIYSVDKR